MLNRNFWRFLTLSILATATIFSFSTKTRATELLTNGGFETGLVGWTEVNNNTVDPTRRYVFNPGAGNNLFEQSNLIAKNPYLPPSFPQEGNRDVMMALATQGIPTVTIRFFQNITVPAGNNLTLSWKQKFSQNNGAAISDDEIVAKVLVRNTSDVLLQTVYSRTLNNQTDEVFPWTTHSINLGNTYAGQTIRIEFQATVFDANGPNFFTNRGLWEIDAVSANATPPTAATASVGGRVTNSRGEGVYKARVTATDADGEILTAMTNPFGYYSFSVVEIGQSYILQLKKRGSNLMAAQRIVTPFGDLTDENFVIDDEPPPSNKSKKK